MDQWLLECGKIPTKFCKHVWKFVSSANCTGGVSIKGDFEGKGFEDACCHHKNCGANVTFGRQLDLI
jgi:hypothetical protein